MGEYRRPHYNLMLSRLSERRKCIFVLAGPRQVGKSTVMAQIAETIDKVVFQFNADSVNEEDSDWIRRSWESVRSRMDIQHLQEAVLVIDEIQKIRRWSEYVKREWDADTLNHVNLKVVLLGSSRLARRTILAILIAAFIGAMVVMGIITFFSAIVRSHTVLLIIGLMVGYLASSAISLLNFFSTAEGVKSYMVWGMGSFGNVSSQQVMFFIPLALIALAASLLLVKPLNAMLLGEQYAENLGFNIRRLRIVLLIITGLLTAVVTAFCGPIAFIGLATPHIARLIISTENHRRLLPVTMLMGAAIALLCNLFCTLPSDGGIIPLNAVTPLFGAPVIIYVLVKRR